MAIRNNRVGTAMQFEEYVKIYGQVPSCPKLKPLRCQEKLKDLKPLELEQNRPQFLSENMVFDRNRVYSVFQDDEDQSTEEGNIDPSELGDEDESGSNLAEKISQSLQIKNKFQPQQQQNISNKQKEINEDRHRSKSERVTIFSILERKRQQSSVEMSSQKI